MAPRFPVFDVRLPAPERVCAAPHCGALLTDPVGVLLDQERWPDHLCMDLMRASTQSWADAIAPRDEARYEFAGCPCPDCEDRTEEYTARRGSGSFAYSDPILAPFPLPVGRDLVATAWARTPFDGFEHGEQYPIDRKSTRLNSSHIQKSRMPSSA